jgi:hypothetical protein
LSNEELFVATAIKSWTNVISRIEKLLFSLREDDLQLEVAPGRNRVYWIIGHLAAHHDRLLPMLRIGERLYPELDELFIDNPDRTFEDEFSGDKLRQILVEVNARITEGISSMPPADLLKKHNSVSEEDFKKEPLRNRLAVFESRTSHVMFHAGQIRLVVQP